MRRSPGPATMQVQRNSAAAAAAAGQARQQQPQQRQQQQRHAGRGAAGQAQGRRAAAADAPNRRAAERARQQQSSFPRVLDLQITEEAAASARIALELQFPVNPAPAEVRAGSSARAQTASQADSASSLAGYLRSTGQLDAGAAAATAAAAVAAAGEVMPDLAGWEAAGDVAAATFAYVQSCLTLPGWSPGWLQSRRFVKTQVIDGRKVAVTCVTYQFSVTDVADILPCLDSQTGRIIVPGSEPAVSVPARFNGIPIRCFDLSGTQGIEPARWQAMLQAAGLTVLSTAWARDAEGREFQDVVRVVLAVAGQVPATVQLAGAEGMHLVMREVLPRQGVPAFSAEGFRQTVTAGLAREWLVQQGPLLREQQQRAAAAQQQQEQPAPAARPVGAAAQEEPQPAAAPQPQQQQQQRPAGETAGVQREQSTATQHPAPGPEQEMPQPAAAPEQQRQPQQQQVPEVPATQAGADTAEEPGQPQTQHRKRSRAAATPTAPGSDQQEPDAADTDEQQQLAEGRLRLFRQILAAAQQRQQQQQQAAPAQQRRSPPKPRRRQQQQQQRGAPSGRPRRAASSPVPADLPSILPDGVDAQALNPPVPEGASPFAPPALQQPDA